MIINKEFEIYLDNLLLPINPAKYEIKNEINVETIESAGIGDVNVIGYEKLKTINLESFFPCRFHTFIRYNRVYTTAEAYINHILDIFTNKKIVRLIIANNIQTIINKEFIISKFEYSESYEDNGDIPYLIELKEYVYMNSTTTESEEYTQNFTRCEDYHDQNESIFEQKYTVKSGDYLIKIARTHYGDANKWTDIYNYNKETIGANPHLIFPGQILILP